MLRLKSLELSGFKSFADRTRLDFPAGITAVIGPNGCGKSNLADAIGFVLGLHTAKELRGEKMEDFIFGGTQKRRPSGLAEVSIRFQRTGEIPLVLEGVELEGDELEITRRLYRSGESVYLVNQRRCRLMDIHRFMEDAGLGFSGYAMIAQGKIEAFLGSRPLERRALLEEAAQISGYKVRRRQAEVKLELAQQNLLRINDILVEVERQLRSLRRQAAKARQYRKVKEEFRRVQKLRFRLEADRLGNRLNGLLVSLSRLRVEEGEVQVQVQAAEDQVRRLGLVRTELESGVQELQEQNSELTLKLDRNRNSLRFAAQQLEQTEQTRASEIQEREKLSAALSTQRQEAERFARELQSLNGEEESAASHQRSAQAQLEKARRALEEAENLLEEERSRLVGAAADAASFRNQAEQIRIRQQRLESDRQRLQAQRAALSDSLRGLEAQVAEKRATLEKRQAQLQDAARDLQRFRSEAEKLDHELAGLREQEAEIRHQLVALQERQQSLQELELSRAPYSESVKKVLGHLSRNRTVQTSGTLADAVETMPEFERLVEEFLDEELECILVDSLDEAVRGVTEAKHLKTGKCTFMSLVSTNGFGRNGRSGAGRELPGVEAGVYGRLGELLKMKPSVQEAFLRVFPQQADTIVVSDLDCAWRLAHSHPESTFLTLQGEALQPRGLVTAVAAPAGKLGLLGLKRQLRELEKRVEAQLAAAAAAAERKHQTEEKLQALQGEVQRRQEHLHRLEKETIGLVHALEQSESDRTRRRRELAALEADLERLDAEAAELGSRLEAAAAETAAREALKTQIETALKIGRDRVQQFRDQLAAVQAEVTRASSQYRLLEERRRSLTATWERIQRQIEESEARLRVSGEREAAAVERIRALRDETARLKEEGSELTKAAETVTGRLAAAREELAGCRDRMAEAEAGLEQLRLRLTGVQSRCNEAEVERARLETQLQHLETDCQEQLGVALAEALVGAVPGAEDPAEIASRYEHLRRRLDSFGPINMTALKDYQEAEQRRQFLAEQRADLEKSIADTTQAIQELNRRSRTQFTETFAQVNQNFQQVFQKLFGGGECGMRLLDEDDVLECGIDLYAQPPGKKLQNVMLLSGGEKALTVFALLVAIFMYRPSRFCVLDEVDAPLDDANVQRFGQLIRSMSEQTQFIVVTHNKRTMEHAHALYGVTMEEPGVSKVVSASF
ncbi:MAG: chromosome segregation protein SMC [Acidobacteriota bacterium]